MTVINQMDQQHLDLVFFEQKPKYDDQARLSLQPIPKLELIKIISCKFQKRLCLNIPFN